MAMAQPRPGEARDVALILALLEAAGVFTAAWLTQVRAAPEAPLSVLAVRSLALSVCSLLIFYYGGLYDLRAIRSFVQSAPRLPCALSVALLPLLADGVLLPGPALPGAAYASALLAALIFLLSLRAAAYTLLSSPSYVERVLMVGGSSLAHELVVEIDARPDLRQRVVGVIDDSGAAPGPGWRRLGGLADLGPVVEKVRPHRVIVALATRRGHMPLKALLQLRVRGVVVEDGADVYERLTGKVAVESLTPSTLIFSRDYRAFRLDLAMTRALNQPITAIALLLLLPVFLLIALAIKLDSRGPVFFVQERVGRGGRLFRLIKFRTMHPSPSTTSEWARDNSRRLTRVGRWLRRFRLDELPQLVNILKGDMNLVGPRPHPVCNFPLFVMVMRNTPRCGEQIPYYALRSLVRPGITGWAQVRYRYANDLEEEIEKMRYDLYYIKHRSFWLDLRILLETVRIVLRGREGAHAAAAEPRPAARGPRMTPLPARVRRGRAGEAALEVGMAATALSRSVAESVAAPAGVPALLGRDVPKA